MKKWQRLFDIKELGDINKPLTPRILSNPNHPITKHILYLYSMECFIYNDLNKACRDQNSDEIEYYGAFAAALSFILNSANRNRKDKLCGQQTLYRGVKLCNMEALSYEIGSIIYLTGYVSSSLDRTIALQHATKDHDDIDQNTTSLLTPVLFEILFEGERGLFNMNDQEYTAFQEDEVLIQDGFPYRVLDN